MKKFLIIFVILVVFILGFVLAKSVFPIDVYVMNGDSMTPTFIAGDKLKFEKNTGVIQRNDVVVILNKNSELYKANSDTELIKRVIGLPGEKISIKKGVIFINGLESKEFGNLPVKDFDGSLQTIDEVNLADKQYYVIGDNPSKSMDSRSFGPVRIDQIVGIINGKY